MLYVITDGSDYAKVGITKDINTRLKVMRTGNPSDLRVLYVFKVVGVDDKTVEERIYELLATKNKRRENGRRSEWYDLAAVINLLECNLFMLAGRLGKRCEEILISNDADGITGRKEVDYPIMLANAFERIEKQEQTIIRLRDEIDMLRAKLSNKPSEKLAI